MDVNLPGAVRRDRIAALIQERGFIRVAELSRIFRTSPVTIRSDLDELESLDLVRRVHGGAVSTSGPATSGPPVVVDPRGKAKASIGALAASLVEPGSTLVLSGGTTAQAVARALVQRTELEALTVVTNGLQTALELRASVNRFSIVVTGGTLLADSSELGDPLGDLVLRNVSADLVIAGCKGVTATLGATHADFSRAALARHLMQSGRRRIIVADGSKVGTDAPARFWDAGKIDLLITDASASTSGVNDLRDAGVEVQTTK